MKKKSKALDLELTSSSMLIETGDKKMKKLLIIYYSWSNGNTERIAKMLQSETDSDILKIDTVVPYSGSYDDVVNQGQNEVQRGYEPEIKPLDINIADYDVIAVGTPTWWYTMAPAVKTFLHQQDFTGKTVVPFMTNGGWPGHVIKDMKAACKNANVVCDMQIQFDSTGGSNLETPQEQINEWIQSVKNLF
ncbi:flavodoxin [Holdemanella porci]|uniref:flavodoxin n=1 Tax=Holdemanella porci TaxID=2652276 RepID=UPI003AB5301A